MKEQIVDPTMTNAGIRGIGRVLYNSIYAVVRSLKHSRHDV